MLKNPFVKNKDKFKILPHISSNAAKDEVAKKLLWAYLGHWGTFALWLVVSYNFIPMIFVLVALMWCIGGVTAVRIPTEASDISRSTRFTVFTYIAALMAWRLIMYIVLKTPIELWQKAFMVKLPDAFANTFLGYVHMAFVVGMFMGFIAYLNYIFQLFKFHKTEKSTSDYMTKVMRRGDGK